MGEWYDLVTDLEVVRLARGGVTIGMVARCGHGPHRFRHRHMAPGEVRRFCVGSAGVNAWTIEHTIGLSVAAASDVAAILDRERIEAEHRMKPADTSRQHACPCPGTDGRTVG
jgi:hypothetical protein